MCHQFYRWSPRMIEHNDGLIRLLGFPCSMLYLALFCRIFLNLHVIKDFKGKLFCIGIRHLAKLHWRTNPVLCSLDRPWVRLRLFRQCFWETHCYPRIGVAAARNTHYKYCTRSCVDYQSRANQVSFQFFKALKAIWQPCTMHEIGCGSIGLMAINIWKKVIPSLISCCRLRRRPGLPDYHQVTLLFL